MRPASVASAAVKARAFGRGRGPAAARPARYRRRAGGGRRETDDPHSTTTDRRRLAADRRDRVAAEQRIDDRGNRQPKDADGELIEPLAVVDRGGGTASTGNQPRHPARRSRHSTPAGAESPQAIRLSKSVLICVTAMPSVMGSIDQQHSKRTPRGWRRPDRSRTDSRASQVPAIARRIGERPRPAPRRRRHRPGPICRARSKAPRTRRRPASRRSTATARARASETRTALATRGRSLRLARQMNTR